MRAALRVAALFAVYSAIGFGGDFAAALVGHERGAHADRLFTHGGSHEAPVVDVIMDVQPEIEVEVQVRHAYDRRCSFSASHEIRIPIQNVGVFGIEAGSGELRVIGEDGLDEIVVQVEACASEEAWLDELTAALEERPSGIALVTRYPERRGWDGGGTARIDLDVRAPLGLDFDILDSSGDIEVYGSGNLRIQDSSGSIRLAGIRGDLDLDDSSGGLDIEDVDGDVTVEDGSGGLEIRGVAGSVLLRDGSGGIEIRDVARDVLVEVDGSGSIDVRGVGGDFIVDRDGSGSIRHSDVEGRVEIPESERRRRRGGR